MGVRGSYAKTFTGGGAKKTPARDPKSKRGHEGHQGQEPRLHDPKVGALRYPDKVAAPAGGAKKSRVRTKQDR